MCRGSLVLLLLAGCVAEKKSEPRAVIVARYRLEPAEEGLCFSRAADLSSAEAENVGDANWRAVYAARTSLQVCRDLVHRNEQAANVAAPATAVSPPPPVDNTPWWKKQTLAERAKAAPGLTRGQLEMIPESERMPQEQRQFDKMRKEDERERRREEIAAAKAEKEEAVRARSRGRKRSNPVEVSLSELLSTYQDNEVNGDHRFSGRWVEVTGPIYTIGKDFLGGIYIIVEGSLHCSTDGEQSIVRSLHPGQQVTVRGIVGGMILGSVMLRQCYVDRYWR